MEDEEWAETLAEKKGIPFDPAVVKSTWVKLDRFDKYGPIGLAFTKQEQALLWALLMPNVGILECLRVSSDHHYCSDACPSWHDLADAIIRKLPAPTLQHNWAVDLENLITAVNRAVIQNPGEADAEYMARVQALHAQHLREEADTMVTLERMLGTGEPEGRVD